MLYQPIKISGGRSFISKQTSKTLQNFEFCKNANLVILTSNLGVKATKRKIPQYAEMTYWIVF